MVKIILGIFLLISSKVFACASFIADPSDIRSGGNEKHFFSHLSEQKRLILKNETSEPCEVRLETMDILQNLNGDFKYVKFIPGRNLFRSLSSGLSIIGPDGSEILWREIVLRPNERLVTRLTMNTEVSGTSHTSVRAIFPQYPMSLVLTEIFYTRDIEQPLLSFDGLKFSPSTLQLDYTLKGRGESYTFVTFEMKLIDPTTGFEVDSFLPGTPDERKFRGFIRNYWVPGANNEKIIKAPLLMTGYINAFKEQFRANFPEESLPEAVVLYIRPRYGIDVEGWKNHHFLTLPPKTIEIRL